MLQQATHIPSGAKGTIIGLNNQKKAHIIQLQTGQQQYWKIESTLKGEEEMKGDYQFILTHKNLETLERYFDTAESAAQYLSELACFNNLHDFSDGNLSASLKNGWVINSTHDLKKLMKEKSKTNLIRLPRTKKTDSPDKLEQPEKKVRKRPSGDIVKLQDLTSDPRKARVILRGLVRNKVIVKPGRWEWSEGSEELEIVRNALKK